VCAVRGSKREYTQKCVPCPPGLFKTHRSVTNDRPIVAVILDNFLNCQKQTPKAFSRQTDAKPRVVKNQRTPNKTGSGSLSMGSTQKLVLCGSL